MKKKTIKLAKDVIIITLFLYAVFMLLYLIYHYITHSSTYVTHYQLAGVILGISSSIFAGFLAMWLNITNKLTEFAGTLGEIKGRVAHLNSSETKTTKRKSKKSR